jgi:hypothetical protein
VSGKAAMARRQKAVCNGLSDVCSATSATAGPMVPHSTPAIVISR